MQNFQEHMEKHNWFTTKSRLNLYLTANMAEMTTCIMTNRGQGTSCTN